MAKVMRPVYQCDMKGCQFISLNEGEMTNVEFVAYDEENGKFYMKNMLLCNQHLKDYQKLSGDKSTSKKESKEANFSHQKMEQKIEKKQENKKNVKKDLKKEAKRDNINTARTDVRGMKKDTIVVNSENDMQPYSAFYNVHEFHITKNEKQLPGLYRIIIAPLSIEYESHGTEIGVLIEKPDGSKETLCSTMEERQTVQFSDEENKISFTCRGYWESGFFRSKIYSGSMEDRSVKIEKEDEKVISYHPEEYDREYYQSHYQVTIKDGLKLYIIPIMQKNYLNQFTKLLVVTETNLQRSALTDSDQYNEGEVELSYEETRYRITGAWQNHEFYADVTTIN